MATVIQAVTTSRTNSQGAALLQDLIAGESTNVLQVIIKVHFGDLFIGGTNVSIVNGLKLSKVDPPLVLNFPTTAGTFANDQLAFLADGSIPTVFSIFTSGA